jgi:hypothetical protein
MYWWLALSVITGESKKVVPTGGDGDDDGDDDAHGDEHDDGPYIFQASRPKDAPQYRVSSSSHLHQQRARKRASQQTA